MKLLNSTPDVDWKRKKIVQSDYGPIIINRHDDTIGAHIVEYGYWFKDDIRLFEAIIKFKLRLNRPLMVYDIGANIGTVSLALAQIFKGKDITIRAFEAQSEIYDMFCRTMAMNNIANVHAEHCIISDQSGEVIMLDLPDYDQSQNFGGYSVLKSGKIKNHETVKPKQEEVITRKIDDYHERVDFIKIDIEGMEEKALRGALNTISTYRPACFIEFFQTDRRFLANFFQQLDYNCWIKGVDIFVCPREDQTEFGGLEKMF